MRNLKHLLLIAALTISFGAKSQITIQETGGWFESGYVTFTLDANAKNYNVYYKTADTEYKQIDAPLVRNYGSYGRADVVGVPAGEYTLKVVPVDASDAEMTAQAVETSAITIKAHDRTGYAFWGGKAPGAYTLNGTLKPNTIVLYVTNENKDNITADITMSNKGTTTCTGLQGILDGFKKGYETRPLCIRIIGQITDPSYLLNGDIVVDMNGKTTCPGITIEGVGNDATIDGWGIRIKGASSVEISNLGTMNTDSSEKDNVGLQQDNSYIWIHNCDFFYGHAGSDGDQAKGDGALDCKLSNYVTISYNHFWDAGKSNLLGMKNENDQEYATYHHNWYDHSDSRHPRVRGYSAHIYNNYYDGVAKYGVGSTMASSLFVESNYYRNTNRPMMISMQGTDINNSEGTGTFSKENGGIIKAYGNVFAEKSSNFKFVTYQENNVEFDAYLATTRDEQVPATVKTKQGGTSYNNFDTDATRFYTCTPDAAEDVPAIVTGQYGAGRMQHGDFQWTFDNAVDDASYDVNTALKSALLAYKTTLVGLFTDEFTGEGGGEGGGDTGNEGGDGGNEGGNTGGGDVVIPSQGYECHFTGMKASNSFYTINGNYSNSKGSATVNGTTYSECLKIESSTNVSFTIGEEMTLTLVFKEGSTPNIKLDGTKVTATNGNIITATVTAGTHTLTKADSHFLFYINLTPALSSGVNEVKIDDPDAPIYDLMGRLVTEPQPGKMYIQNGKKFIKR